MVRAQDRLCEKRSADLAVSMLALAEEVKTVQGTCKE